MSSDNQKMATFAENLRKLMFDRRVTAKVISQATGIAQSTLSEWSAGRTPKLTNDVMKLAQFFGVSIEYLLNGEEGTSSIIEDLLHDDDFVTVHTGVYRIRVDKHLRPIKKKE